MRVGVVYYPGSNCEQDAVWACRQVGLDARLIWHKEKSVDGCEALILAGGFSYGDHLRCGAIARFSPVMRAVENFAADGGLVLGICNGFQILVESGLLPGALLANDGLKFRCQDTVMRVERVDTPYTNACDEGQLLRINMAHYEGNYFAAADTVARLEEEGRVVLRFVTPAGERGGAANPNGSINDIAAVSDKSGRIMGLMPHPERVMDPRLGSADGRFVFESLRNTLAERGTRQESGRPASVTAEAGGGR